MFVCMFVWLFDRFADWLVGRVCVCFCFAFSFFVSLSICLFVCAFNLLLFEFLCSINFPNFYCTNASHSRIFKLKLWRSQGYVPSRVVLLMSIIASYFFLTIVLCDDFQSPFSWWFLNLPLPSMLYLSIYLLSLSPPTILLYIHLLINISLYVVVGHCGSRHSPTAIWAREATG